MNVNRTDVYHMYVSYIYPNVPDLTDDRITLLKAIKNKLDIERII